MQNVLCEQLQSKFLLLNAGVFTCTDDVPPEGQKLLHIRDFSLEFFLIDALLAGTLRSRPCAWVLPSTFAVSHLFQPAR